MNLFKKDKAEISSSVVNWDNWKPGDAKAAEIAFSGNWLRQTFKRQNIEMPPVEENILDKVVRIVSEELENGSAEAKVVKRIATDVSLPKEVSKLLAHFATSAAMTERAMESYRETQIARVEWLGGCCEICDVNDGVVVPIDSAFPSGHFFPPACTYCLCSIAPQMDI